jgi:predicted aspartyl protease
LKMLSTYHEGVLKELAAVNSFYQESISFIGLLEKDSFKIPQKIKLNTGFPLSSYSFKSIKKVLKPINWFKKPEYQAMGVSYNTEISPKIEVRKTASGHLFIKPKIQGKEVGWFLFDSGAGISLIEHEAIKGLNLNVVGKQIVGGIGGKLIENEVITVENISIGPLTIDKLNFIESKKTLTELSISKGSKILGEPIMGVLGWDILIRSIVEMDMKNGLLSIYNADNYELDKKYLEKLFLHWNVPYVQATFEGDKKGYFLIDSGAGNEGPIFHSIAVDRLDLLSNHKTESSKVSGAGGDANVEIGTLDWFQVGGYRTSNITSIFLQGDDGEADLFTDGFLGGKVIESRIIVFDYANNKIGFIPR